MVVSGLVIGLPAYVLVKVLTPNFFARKDTRTPVFTAAISLAVTAALNYYFIFMIGLGVVGLAIAGAVGAWTNIALLAGILHVRGFYRMPRRIFGRILRIAIAAGAMGAALWWLMTQIEPWFVGTFSQQAAGLVAIIGTGMFTYAIAAIMLGVLDKATLQRLMRRQT